ncbi:unnamed protein product [Symbiodinium microadriaticum]|nr:unnamed protein product [Symbiodinium microadriaticum]
MFAAGDVFPSHHFLGLLKSKDPSRQKLRFGFALVVFGFSVPASHCIQDGHGSWTMERIVLFNNHSRNVIPDWGPQAYIDQSVNFANMLRRCNGLDLHDYILKQVDWTSSGPILHDFLGFLALRSLTIPGIRRSHGFTYLEIGGSHLRHFFAQTRLLQELYSDRGWLAVAMDVEAPNPAVERLWFGKRQEATWSNDWACASQNLESMVRPFSCGRDSHEHMFAYWPRHGTHRQRLQEFVKKNISRSIWYLQGTIVDGRQADFRDCIHRVSKASAGDWNCTLNDPKDRGAISEMLPSRGEDQENVWSILGQHLFGQNLSLGTARNPLRDIILIITL